MTLVVEKIILAGMIYVKLANEREPIENLEVVNSKFLFMKNVFPDNQQNLIKLILSKCGIQKIFSNSFKNLRLLQYLDLSFNKIIGIHELLFVANPELETIYLNDNRLEFIYVITFEKNKKLKVIHIQNNCLRLFNNQNLPHLKHLLLKNNVLTDFKNNMFPNLMNLNLSINKLNENSLRGNLMPNLFYVSLSYNSINHLTSDLLQNFENVHYLHMNRNNLTVIRSDWFTKTTQLITLSLASNQLYEIRDGAFVNLINLKFLNLKNNNFKTIDLEMFRPNEKLIELILDENSIDRLEPESDPVTIQIRTLCIKSNRVILMLAPNCFQSFRNLQKLILRNSNIYCIEDGTFSQLNMLCFLDLSGNYLQDLPSGCLPIQTKIKYFDLSFNKLVRLANDFFTIGTILKSLDLSDNKNLHIHENAFDNISNSLETLRLKTISFENHLIPNLNVLKNLQTIEFDSNRIQAFPNFCFTELTKLFRLKFTKNFDTKTDSFNNLEYPIISDRNSLVYLNFKECRIQRIASNVFRNLLHLEKLNLSKNYLCDLQEDLFANSPQLRYINLNFNQLRNFECNHFKFNDQLIQLYLAGNLMDSLEDKYLNLTNLRLLVLARTCDYVDRIKNSSSLKAVFL